MKKRTFYKFLFILLLLLIISISTFFAGIKFATNEGKTEITDTLIQNEIKEVKKLITTEYSYSKVGKFKNSLKFNGWELPYSEKSFLLTYSGTIELGVDLDKMKIHIQDNEIQIILPPIDILNNTINEESIEIYDEKNNLFNPIEIEDYKNFALKEKQKAKQEAIDKGLYKEAEEKTISSITSLIHMITEDYTVHIQFKKS